jgi:hypothetical protein
MLLPLAQDLTPEKMDELKTITREALHEDTVRITFTKKDGTERVLLGTLKSDAIPADKQPKEGTKPAKTSDDAQAVFDTTIGEWRSFRWDSVKLVEVDYELNY